MSRGQRLTVEEILKAREEHWPEAVTPTMQMLIRIFRLTNLFLEDTTHLIETFGLTFTEFEVLVTLRGVAPPHELLPTELYSAILISSGGLTKVLRSLESKNLITRSHHETDGRTKPVRLSHEGTAMAERAMYDVLNADAEAIDKCLSASERDTLVRLLRKILAKLE